MAINSGIAWTKSTFNPFIGCTKVGPGCDNCYAETLDKRTVFGGKTHWGPGVPRMRTSESNWNAVRRWNKIAPESEFAGRKGFWPVFCASLGDVFDNEVPRGWRMDLFQLIAETPNLTWIILTKRIGNVMPMCQHDGLMFDQLANIWLGATVVNQEEADRDLPKLLQIPAKVRFLSMEPLLGPVDLEFNEINIALEPDGYGNTAIVGGIDWVIVGGESGTKARPMHPEWARDLRDQCAAADIPFFFKQWGEWSGPGLSFPDGHPELITPDDTARFKVGTKAAGHELDGKIYQEFPMGA